MTYDVGQYGFYASEATILTDALPRSIVLPQIHKTPYCPHHRSILYWLYHYFGYTIYIVSFILVMYILQNDTFLLKFRIFWSLKFPNSREICWHIKLFGLKTRLHVLLIHKGYRFLCIVILSYRLNNQRWHILTSL